MINLLLNKDTSNYFTINLTDDKGNKLECQPNNFTILEGITTPHAPLPYAWGIEVWNEQKKLSVFEPLKGLEKNQIQNEFQNYKAGGHPDTQTNKTHNDSFNY